MPCDLLVLDISAPTALIFLSPDMFECVVTLRTETVVLILGYWLVNVYFLSEMPFLYTHFRSFTVVTSGTMSFGTKM